MASRKEPPSLDALLAKQKEDTIKPKFLSKAERAKLALEKREAEIKEQREREEKEKQARLEFERKARDEAPRLDPRAGGGRQNGAGQHYDDRYGGRGEQQGRGNVQQYDPRRDRMQNARERHGYQDRDAPPPPPPPTGPRLDREREQQPSRGGFASGGSGPSASSSRPAPAAQGNGNAGNSATTGEVPVTQAEQAVIRNRYLGIHVKAQKKTRRMLNDKRYMFDHDQTEDTSDTLNPDIFDRRVEAAAFGKGGHAGMDPQERGGALVNGIDPLKRSGGKSAFAEKHWSEKRLDEMKERDWRIFREDFSIAAKGGHIPRPLRSWHESDIPKQILSVVADIGYTEPSPIQRQAIPIGLQNRDLIGIAETGSGKTASFVIPMLAYISKLPRMSASNIHLGPYALIIAPTRELAQQIEGETRKFTDSLGYTVVSIVGGRDMNEQAFNLKDGAEIVVATPGRLKDCVERHILVLSQCLYLVLDEADKSIGLGFADQLDFILDSMPATNLKPDTEDAENPNALVAADGSASVEGQYRVTMLYSATMPPSVERLARTYLRRPATITIGDANQAVGTVEQRVEFIAGEDKKKQRLMQILNAGFEPPIIIFSTTKQSVDSLARDLQRAGYQPAILHSGKTQTQREEALASLRSGDCPILVATDLAGRGIDVPDVTLVVNFSFPTMFEAYIHRIGRTGRAGKRGLAITFLENHDEEFFYDLKNEIARSPISTVPRELERHPAAQKRVTREMKRKRDED